jgi:hypothetical protein
MTDKTKESTYSTARGPVIEGVHTPGRSDVQRVRAMVDGKEMIAEPGFEPKE